MPIMLIHKETSENLWNSLTSLKCLISLHFEAGFLILQNVNKTELLCIWFLPFKNSVCHTSNISVQLCQTLCNPIDCSTPGLPVHHQLLELTQTPVSQVGDGIQPSHPPLSPSPPTFNHCQHQGLFQWVSSSHQVAKGMELQHQYYPWIFRVDFL